jgi:molybdate transport system substrate-binding protein
LSPQIRLCGLALLLVVSTGCGGSEAADAGEGSEGGTEELRVFAASSLTDAFEELGAALGETHPRTVLRFNFLSSSDLATQLEQGAEADVYASADEANMDRVVEAGLAQEPRIFARNELEIAVAEGNPRGIGSLADLAEDDLVVALCSADCPAGAYARDALAKAGVRLRPDSLEPDVKAVVTRVQLGEADAGIVYASDVAAAQEDLDGVQIPRAQNVVATYPIAVLQGAPAAAREFVRLVLSRRGQEVLEEHGFLPR